MTGRLPPHLPAPAVSASRAAFPAGATQPVLPGPQIPRAPPGMATVPAPPAPHAPSVCGPGVVAILSRSGCVAAPRNGRPTPDPRPGGSGTGSAAPALSLGHGDLQQTGPRAPGSRAFPPRTREATETPRLAPSLGTLPPWPAGPSLRPAAATCAQRRVCAPRPWGGACGLPATEPEPLRPPAARPPAGPGFLSWPLPLSPLSSLPGLFQPPHPAHPPFQ